MSQFMKGRQCLSVRSSLYIAFVLMASVGAGLDAQPISNPRPRRRVGRSRRIRTRPSRFGASIKAGL